MANGPPRLSALHARMPQKLDATFSQIVDKAQGRNLEFPSKALNKAFQKFLDENVAKGDAELLKSSLTPLTDVIVRYSEGLKAHEYSVMIKFLEMYWTVEQLFSSRTARDDEVVLKLRDENRDNITNVVHMVLSHTRVSTKNSPCHCHPGPLPNRTNQVLATLPSTSKKSSRSSPTWSPGKLPKCL